MRKDKLGGSPMICHCEHGHENDDNAGGSPVDAELVEKVEITRAESIDQRTDEHDSPEAQHRLPLVGDEVLIEDGDGAEDELGTRKIDGQGDGPVADEGEPAVDEADEGRPLGTAEHGAPVVNTSCSGEDGAYLGEGGGDTERDEGDQDPAVENGDGLAIGEGDVHRRGQAEGHSHNGKGQAENAEHAEVPWQLALVAQPREGLIGLVHRRLSCVCHGGGWPATAAGIAG